jgi:murein L,D-transpeptidase YafK
VLLLYKALGEKQLDTTKLKVKKVVAKAMPSTPKKEKGDDKTPESLKSK